MAVRDRCVAAVLAAGLLLGMLAWRELGAWAGIPTAMLALALACAVYRVDRGARRRGRGPSDDAAGTADDEADALSTPRRAAAPPSRSGRGS